MCRKVYTDNRAAGKYTNNMQESIHRQHAGKYKQTTQRETIHRKPAGRYTNNMQESIHTCIRQHAGKYTQTTDRDFAEAIAVSDTYIERQMYTTQNKLRILNILNFLCS